MTPAEAFTLGRAKARAAGVPPLTQDQIDHVEALLAPHRTRTEETAA